MYAEHRQCPTDGPSSEEVEAALGAIADRFTTSWLANQKGAHELQRLWCRKDLLATIELVTFGSALKSADAIDSAWTSRQVDIMRRPDANNRRGACFEILGLGYFAPTYHVTPSPGNKPGYDLSVRMTDSHQLRVSLKCYAESSHERSFHKRADQAREKFLCAGSGHFHAVQVLVEALVHPNESEWQQLFTEITKLAGRFNGLPLTVRLGEAWTISVGALAPPPGEALSPQNLSYTFICVAPYHKNEQQNFISKLESAISNLEKNVDGTDGELGWIVIRLPPTASSNSLKTWAQEYLSGLADSKVLCVSFVQPYIAIDSVGRNYVAHHFAAAVSPKLAHLIKPLQLVTPFGVSTSQPPFWQLQGSDNPVLLDDRYMHQSGKHFVLARVHGSELKGNVSQKAPGIEQVAAFNVGDQQIVFGGRWGTDLILIGG